MPKPNIQLIVESKDLESLEYALRLREDPEIRRQAAAGLAALGDLKAVDILIRSFLEDPEESVRTAARLSLYELLGKPVAQNAINIYRSMGLDRNEWLLDRWAGDDDYLSIEPEWDASDIHGLIGVLKNENQSTLRVKAVRVLQNLNNTEAFEALANVAMQDENEEVRQAAREVLENIYGERLEEVLKIYQNPDTEDEEEEEEYNPLDLAALNQKPQPGVFNSTPPDHPQPLRPAFPPAIQEDNPTVRFIITLLILMVVAGFVYFFILRP